MNLENPIITYHAKERYVMRFKGIEEDKVKDYIKENTDIIVRDLKRMYKHSKFLYNGKSSPDKKRMSFYINNNVMLIVLNNKIITLYRINEDMDDFSKDTDKMKALKIIMEDNNREYNHKKRIISNTKRGIRKCEKILRNNSNELDKTIALSDMQNLYANKIDIERDLSFIKKQNNDYLNLLINKN